MENKKVPAMYVCLKINGEVKIYKTEKSALNCNAKTIHVFNKNNKKIYIMYKRQGKYIKRNVMK